MPICRCVWSMSPLVSVFLKAEKKPCRGVQVEKPRLVLWRVNTMPICRLCKGGRLSFPYDRELGLGLGVELGLGLGLG